MAASLTFIDVPAKYLFGMDLLVQKAINKALAWYDHAPHVLVNYAASGAIAKQGTYDVITKTGSLAALTLAAPTAAEAGMVKVITSTTAFAHTVTATGLFDNGVTGGSKNTATFAAFAGASMTIMATAGGKWNIIALQNVTVA